MKRFQKLLSFFLMPLLSIFASGVSVHTHFCKGELMEASVFLPVEGCEMPDLKSSCSAPATDCENTPHVQKPGCCEDHSDFFQLPTFSKDNQTVLPILFFAALLPENSLNPVAQQALFEVTPPAHGPPLQPSGQSIRILFASFLC